MKDHNPMMDKAMKEHMRTHGGMDMEPKMKQPKDMPPKKMKSKMKDKKHN